MLNRVTSSFRERFTNRFVNDQVTSNLVIIDKIKNYEIFVEPFLGVGSCGEALNEEPERTEVLHLGGKFTL